MTDVHYKHIKNIGNHIYIQYSFPVIKIIFHTFLNNKIIIGKYFNLVHCSKNKLIKYRTSAIKYFTNLGITFFPPRLKQGIVRNCIGFQQR